MNSTLENSVSVVILNYDQVDTTLRAVDCANASEGGFVKEIIVVDNGSSADVLSALRASLRQTAEIVALGKNRFFGEGNNVGVERASGDLVLLLNNDAYVEPNCIAELVATLEANPSISAVGPMFLYPDGSVQEVGALVLPTGDVVQIGKGAVWAADHYTDTCEVDYCSAACLLLRRKHFLQAGGFALQWEPAYYEDVDLCLTLWRDVGPVVVNPKARVTHVESLTTSSARMRLEAQVEINRRAFVDKWGPWISAKRGYRPLSDLAAVAKFEPAEAEPADFVAAAGFAAAAEYEPAGSGPARSSRGRSRRSTTAVLYTPYDLVPGGGERVLFELAATLVARFGQSNVRVQSTHPYSDLRMWQLSQAFGLETYPVSAHYRGEGNPDVMFVLGNEVVPVISGHASKTNIFICQFPFHAADAHLDQKAPNLASFDEIWVYSEFVRQYVSGFLQLLGLRPPTIRVVYPPATVAEPARVIPWADRSAVITVGRFFKGGHNKRQDVVIEIVRHLQEEYGRRVPLVVAGSLHPDISSRERFNELVEAAHGMDCHFYPNIGRERLVELYASSAVLVHATGFGVDGLDYPERLEHFGIVPIEAASVGCIPVVYGDGGPAEAMKLLGASTTFTTVDDAARTLDRLFAEPADTQALSQRLIERAQIFSREAFRRNVEDALGNLLATSP